MPSITDLLRQDHRVIEEHLDALEAALPGSLYENVLRVEEHLQAHARREAAFWECLEWHAPSLAEKLLRQHLEAYEAMSYFGQAYALDQTRDMLRLARRYHAIVQHNLIEEERDVFPLADRCFTPQEQEVLTQAYFKL